MIYITKRMPIRASPMSDLHVGSSERIDAKRAAAPAASRFPLIGRGIADLIVDESKECWGNSM